ncbi:MAG: glycosyltransferase [Desulfosoma sp.]|uniref:glycosyltransferase n=1 Tax=Desulfosoma sp. TaxID=2603217 RepID=UPI00404951FC
MSSKPSLSVCMIVKNEASNICDALESFQSFADEIVVVDTGSTDATVDLARRFTQHVHNYPWHDDFAAARNFSLDKASGAYCLWLDADDRVDPLNGSKINTLKQHFDGQKAFTFELQDFRKGSLFCSLRQVRCVPNRRAVRFRGRVHECIDWESVKDTITLVNVDVVITHHGYDDAALLSKKIMRNTRLLQLEGQSGRDDPLLHFYLAQSFSHLGSSAEAMKHMQRVIDLLERKRYHVGKQEAEWLNTFWVEAHLFLAKEMSAAERQAEARRLLVKLLTTEALDPYAIFRLGQLYQSLKEHRQALSLFELVDLEKQMPAFLPRLTVTRQHLVAHSAVSLFALGFREEAMRSIASLSDATLEKEVWEAVGLLAGDHGLDTLVEDAFRQALRLGELTAAAWNQWGLVWKARGHLEKAEACWHKALCLEPSLESASIHLGNLLWQSSRIAEAYQVFKDLVVNGCPKLPVLLTYAVLAAHVGEEIETASVQAALNLWLQEDSLSCDCDFSTREKIYKQLSRALEQEGKPDLAKMAKRLAQREATKAFTPRVIPQWSSSAFGSEAVKAQGRAEKLPRAKLL